MEYKSYAFDMDNLYRKLIAGAKNNRHTREYTYADAIHVSDASDVTDLSDASEVADVSNKNTTHAVSALDEQPLILLGKRVKSETPNESDPSPTWSPTTHLYVGSMTIIGLYVLFRALQKSQ